MTNNVRYVHRQKTPNSQQENKYTDSLAVLHKGLVACYVIAREDIADYHNRGREDKASKLGQLYRHCISEALSIWDSMAVNNSMSTKKKKRTLRHANIYGSTERIFFSDYAGISQNALVIMLKNN